MVIIPDYQEIKRQNRVQEKDIQNYKDGSTIVLLSSYENLTKGIVRMPYFDGAPLIKQAGEKIIAYIEDKQSKKIYKIELYHPHSLMMVKDGSGINLKLLINKEELNRKGTMEDPVIALRYTIGDDMTNNVADEKYNFNVKEYLTYKNYKATPMSDPFYVIKMIWMVITLIGFSYTTGTFLKNKKNEFEESQK